MPEALVAPPAATPPAPSAPAAPAKPAVVTPTPITAPPGKRKSAWDSVDDDLRKISGLEPTTPKPQKSEETKRPGTEEADTEPVPAKPDAKADAAAKPEQQPAKEEKGKMSPWKLVDKLKQDRLKLEQEIAQLRERALPEDQWKQTQERLTTAEARAKEYEDEIRFSNYQKSEEFKTNYVAPYEKSWAAAMGELSDLTVTDPATGQARHFETDDMMSLLNLSLPEARKMADELYGPLADDVMAHRKTIRELYEKQAAALKEAKEKGSQREKERQDKFKAEFGTIAKQVREEFEKANKMILDHPEHGKWLKPVEGDEEGNKILEKGMEFARSAFGSNPLKPGLTPEQRADAARRHAAIISRAAVYPRLTRTIKKLEAESTALKKELEQFKSSVPGNGQPPGPKTVPTKKGIDGLFSELDRLAS